MTDFVTSLEGTALLDVRGSDAASFLQAQLTADVARVTRGRSTLTAQCDVKGRVLALFRLLRLDEESFELRVPRGTLAILRSRLEMFRLHATVTFEEPGDRAGVFGVGGPRGEAALSRLLGDVPVEPGGVALGGGLAAARVGTSRRFEVAVRGPSREAFESAVADLPRSGEDAWTRLDVAEGVPRIEAETSGAFLPQMLGLAELGAVSFTKGCFPGQEVVARTQHLGAVRRRLYRATAVASVPAPGTPIRALIDGRERDGGRVVVAAADGNATTLLAVIPIDAAEAELRAGSIDGPRIRVVRAADGGES